MTAVYEIDNLELIETAQEMSVPVDETAVEVVNMIEDAVEAHHYGAFYENPEFWVATAFILVVVFLAKPIGKLINTMLNKRIDMIANRITEARQLNEDAQKMLAEYEKKFLNAEKEAKAILRKSEKEIEFLKDERLKKMEAELQIKQKEAEQRINTAQENAMREITAMASEVTIKAIKEVLLQKLDKSMQSKLIDEAILAIDKKVSSLNMK